MEPYRFHVFACTQQKPEGAPCCSAQGALSLLDDLGREIRERGLDGQVQLTTCGCMGLCEEGPILVVYPEGVWYRRVQASDIPEIVARHLGLGQAVERLVWNDAAAMHALSTEHAEKFRATAAARERAGVLPEHIEQMIRGYMPSRSILTALELDLFTAVGSGARAEEIAAKIEADPRAAAMLLDALVALGLIAKKDGVYRNTPESARFFARDSQDSQRDGLLHTANIWHRWSILTEAVRRGSAVADGRARPSDIGASDWTRNFIAGMQRNARSRAPLVVKTLGVEGVRRILDLGGGSGIYSIAFAQASTDVRCEILDLPEVIPLTSGYVAKAGVSAQVRLRAGDMLKDDLGSGYDLVLLNAICHMFSAEQNRELFRRIRRALAPKGRLAVQDFILNPDKTGPVFAALFSLNMLVGTAGGASYSEPEYAAWMREAGFAEVRRSNLPGPSSLIVGQAA